MDEAFDIRGQEPCEVRSEEVENDMTFRQTTGERQDRIDVVVCRTRTKFSLGKTDGDAFQIRRHNQTSGAGEDAEAAFVDELNTHVRHVREQCRFIQRLRRR